MIICDKDVYGSGICREGRRHSYESKMSNGCSKTTWRLSLSQTIVKSRHACKDIGFNESGQKTELVCGETALYWREEFDLTILYCIFA